MKIRNKLLNLLLVVSLVPILIIVFLTRISIKQLSTRISGDIQAKQLQDTLESVSVHVHNYREAILGSISSLYLSLRLQAREVELCLAEPASDRPHRSPMLPYGFDQHAAASSERMQLSHTVRDGLDLTHQQFFLVAGTDPNTVQGELDALWTMTGIYRDLYEAGYGRTLWHYTSLENGLHTSYPAEITAQWPSGYDPRKRQWYLSAKTNPPNEVAVSISPDAVTKRLVLTVSMPVYRPDGTLGGVTAIDTDLDDILGALTFPRDLVGRAGLFFVSLGGPEEPISDRLVVLFRDHGAADPLDWQAHVDLSELHSSDSAAFAQLLNDLMAGTPGVRIMEYNGKESIWIYSSRIGRKGVLIMIVPLDVVLELAQQARARLVDENFRQLRIAGLVILAVIAVSAALAFLWARRFTTPIDQLAAAAKVLADGDFSAKADIQTGDELQQLAKIFNDVGPKLQEHEKTQRSLALARAIQQNLLPRRAPKFIGFDVAARCRYCDETGGDYYDFIHYPDWQNNRLGVVLGDVTGHGVGAALLMASARSILRNESLHFTGDLAELMGRFNDQLSEDTGDDKFMTLFYGVLDTESRSLIWVSAGHDPAIWYHRGQDDFEELTNTGPLAGYMKNMPYEQAGPVHFEAGDILLVGTDGIWEAEDPTGQPFGKDRLYEFIRLHADRSAKQIVDMIIESVEKFSSPVQPADDITLIVVKTV